MTSESYRQAQMFVEGLSILRGKEFPDAKAHSDAMHEMKVQREQLLEALSCLLDECPLFDYAAMEHESDDYASAKRVARAAIAKATGAI